MFFFLFFIWACQKSLEQQSSIADDVSIYPQSLTEKQCGDTLVEHNGVKVYRNYGKGMHSCGDYHRSSAGYDYGPEWQCVEFVRRYYHLHLNHRFSTKGHAKHYFNEQIPHGALNTDRGLIQYRVGGDEAIQVDDLLVCPAIPPGYGHVAIVAQVEDSRIQIVQQNKLPALEWVAIQRTEKEWSLEWECAGFLRKP